MPRQIEECFWFCIRRLPTKLQQFFIDGNNERKMTQQLRQHYGKNFHEPFYSEDDYEAEYGLVDFDDKRILDLGADIGTTAEYFRRRGAKLVVSVEGSRICFEQLREYASRFSNIVPLFLFVKSSKDLEKLFLSQNFDVVKCDIEGGEVHLINLDDSVFSKVQEYLVECHMPKFSDLFVRKCNRNGYNWKVTKNLTAKTKVIYANKLLCSS